MNLVPDPLAEKKKALRITHLSLVLIGSYGSCYSVSVWNCGLSFSADQPKESQKAKTIVKESTQMEEEKAEEPKKLVINGLFYVWAGLLVEPDVFWMFQIANGVPSETLSFKFYHLSKGAVIYEPNKAEEPTPYFLSDTSLSIKSESMEDQLSPTKTPIKSTMEDQHFKMSMETSASSGKLRLKILPMPSFAYLIWLKVGSPLKIYRFRLLLNENPETIIERVIPLGDSIQNIVEYTSTAHLWNVRPSSFFLTGWSTDTSVHFIERQGLLFTRKISTPCPEGFYLVKLITTYQESDKADLFMGLLQKKNNPSSFYLHLIKSFPGYFFTNIPEEFEEHHLNPYQYKYKLNADYNPLFISVFSGLKTRENIEEEGAAAGGIVKVDVMAVVVQEADIRILFINLK